MDFLIGTLTRIGGPGIALVRLDEDRLTCLWQDSNFRDPNWLSQGPDGRLFAVSSDAEEEDRGCVNEISVSDDGMRLISRKPTGGNAPCHLCFSLDGRFLFAANYGSGSLAVFPLEASGIGSRIQRIQHSGSSAHPTRQTSPHVHQITPIPHLPECYCAVDLGIDALVIYKQDIASGMLTEQYRIGLPRGEGPRHLVYDSEGFGWLATELGNRLFRIRFDTDHGTVTGGLSTVETKESGYAAAVRLSPDGRSVYVSNRGEDSIAVFSLSPFQKTSIWHQVGQLPRDFALLSDTRAVVVCQNEGLVLLNHGVKTAVLSMRGCVSVLPLLR